MNNSETQACPGPHSGAVNLSSLIFSAKIDYLTVHTGGKVALPNVPGTVRWARSKGCTQFSLHDPVADSVMGLTKALGSVPLMELEVSIDIGLKAAAAEEDRLELLSDVMVNLFARGLYPGKGPLMDAAARTFYRRLPHGYVIRPFNLKVPRPTDQQLHGFRSDSAQVKAYLKRTDAGRNLEPIDHVARVEVRLKRRALLEHGVDSLHDLIGFKFRKCLSAYFCFVRSARLRKLDRAPASPLDRLLAEREQMATETEWGRSGVGAVVKGGKVAHREHRLIRDIAVNDRVGQALHRLEQSFHTEKFVCEASVSTRPRQLWRGPAPDRDSHL